MAKREQVQYETDPISAMQEERYRGYEDLPGSVDPKLAREFREAAEARSKRRTEIDKMFLKERQSARKAESDYTKAMRDFLATVNETAAKNARVEKQVLISRLNALTNAATRLVGEHNTYANSVLSPALEALRQNDLAASAEALQKTLDPKSPSYDPSKPAVAALASTWAKAALGEPNLMAEGLGDRAFAQVRAAGGSDELATLTKNFIEQGQSAYSLIESARSGVQTAAQELENIRVSGGMVSGTDMRGMRDALTKSQKSFDNLRLDETKIAEELEKIAEADKDYERLIDNEDLLRRAAFKPGSEGIRTRQGRIVADPDFQRWAKDNGYELGRARVLENGTVQYAPGNDDEAAIVRYHYQARTGKHSPWGPFSPRSSGELVKVTSTDPETRQRMLASADLGDGRYAVDKNTGALVSSATYLERASEEGLEPAVSYARVGKDVFFRDGDKVYKLVAGRAQVAEETDIPAGTAFKPAAYYPPGSTGPTRYLTSSDLDGSLGTSGADFVFGVPDDKELASLSESNPYSYKTAEQLTNVGEVSVIGYRDRLNARDEFDYGKGAISLDGGMNVFGAGARYEVIERPGERRRGSERSRRKAEERAAELFTDRDRAARGAVAEPRVRTPAPAPRPPEQAPAAEEDGLFGPTMGVSAEGAAAPAAPAAPAPAAKPAAPAPSARRAVPRSMYLRRPDGSVLEVIEGEGAREVVAAAGKVVDQTFLPEGSPQYQVATRKPSVRLSPEEAARLPVRVSEAPAPAPAAPKVTQQGVATRIDAGSSVAPTLGEKVGEAVSGAVDKARAAMADRFQRLKDRRAAARDQEKTAERRRRVDESAAATGGLSDTTATFEADKSDVLFGGGPSSITVEPPPAGGVSPATAAAEPSPAELRGDATRARQMLPKALLALRNASGRAADGASAEQKREAAAAQKLLERYNALLQRREAASRGATERPSQAEVEALNADIYREAERLSTRTETGLAAGAAALKRQPQAASDAMMAQVREAPSQPSDVSFGRDLGEGSLTTTTERPLQVVPPAGDKAERLPFYRRVLGLGPRKTQPTNPEPR